MVYLMLERNACRSKARLERSAIILTAPRGRNPRFSSFWKAELNVPTAVTELTGVYLTVNYQNSTQPNIILLHGIVLEHREWDGLSVQGGSGRTRLQVNPKGFSLDVDVLPFQVQFIQSRVLFTSKDVDRNPRSKLLISTQMVEHGEVTLADTVGTQAFHQNSSTSAPALTSGDAPV